MLQSGIFVIIYFYSLRLQYRIELERFNASYKGCKEHG